LNYEYAGKRVARSLLLAVTANRTRENGAAGRVSGRRYNQVEDSVRRKAAGRGERWRERCRGGRRSV